VKETGRGFGNERVASTAGEPFDLLVCPLLMTVLPVGNIDLCTTRRGCSGPSLGEQEALIHVWGTGLAFGSGTVAWTTASDVAYSSVVC
jgi:hypothetical protein